MTIRSRLRSLFVPAPQPPMPPQAAPAAPRSLNVKPEHIAAMRGMGREARDYRDVFKPAKPPKGVVPEGVTPIAMDQDLAGCGNLASQIGIDTIQWRA
jgi:hypothetical protein